MSLVVLGMTKNQFNDLDEYNYRFGLDYLSEVSALPKSVSDAEALGLPGKPEGWSTAIIGDSGDVFYFRSYDNTWQKVGV